MPSQEITSNPLYTSYEATDLSLWEKRSGRVKKRTLLTKPILHQLKNKTNLKGKDWLESNLTEVANVTTWSRRNIAEKKAIKPNYNMNEMLNECDNVMCEIDESASGSSANQFSELISYFDDILYMPKKMSEMAENMYS
ncbi:hypothetical protein KR215_008309 [Drosophila sulfurigaster]|nr:hypothetical protein KR215_008309 [Drosophila sulfurigaster]